MENENGVVKFWKLIFRNFWNLVIQNFLYFLLTLPILVWIYVYANGYLNGDGGTQDFFPGISYFAVLVLQMPTALFYVLAFVSAVIRGPLSMGMAFVTKSLISGRKMRLRDLFTQAGKNFKQGIIFGLCEVILLIIALINIFGGLQSDVTYLNTVLMISKWVTVFILIFLSLLRPYLYLNAVSVRLGTLAIIKNSGIFAIMNIWKNLLALVIICVFWIVTVSVFPIISLFTLPLIAYSFQWLCYGTLCYPMVKKFLIDTQTE